MLRRIARLFREAGAGAEIVQIGGEPVRGCTACGTCKETRDGKCKEDRDIINSCIEKMIASDVIVIGSPVYFSQMTPEAKALIDRSGYVAGANGKLFSRKIGAALAVARRAGRMTTFNAINQFFLINDMIVPGSTYWNVGVAREEGEIENDQEGLSTIDRLAENILWLHERIKGE